MTIPPSPPDEWFPLLDRRGRVTGRARRADCHGRPALRHPVVHARIVRPDGALLLQRRAATKDVQPGRWDTSVGGHVHDGEQIVAAVVRETAEEIGVAARVDGDAPSLDYPPDADARARPAPPPSPPLPDGAPTAALRFLFAYDHANAFETERVFVFEGACAGPFVPQPGEVDELRFWPPAALAAAPADALTPNLRDELRRVAAWRRDGAAPGPTDSD